MIRKRSRGVWRGGVGKVPTRATRWRPTLLHAPLWSSGRRGEPSTDCDRLNATCRERLVALTRRGRALARRTLTLHHGMYLIGTVYNFCTPHASLAQVGGKTTPAMAAGITDHLLECGRIVVVSRAATLLDAAHAAGASLTCAQTSHQAVVQEPRLAVELPRDPTP